MNEEEGCNKDAMESFYRYPASDRLFIRNSVSFGDKQINVRLTKEFKDACEAKAKSCSISLNEWIRRAMVDSLEDRYSNLSNQVEPLKNELVETKSKLSETTSELTRTTYELTKETLKRVGLEEQIKQLRQKVKELEASAAEPTTSNTSQQGISRPEIEELISRIIDEKLFLERTTNRDEK